MWDALTEAMVSFALNVIRLFPESPFTILEGMSNSEFYVWLQYVNWFVPIGTFVSILETWLVCVAVYYVYQIALRWVKVIE